LHKILSLAIFLLLAPGARLLSQIPAKPVSKALPARRVNGVVRDSLGKSIPSAAVRLVSPKDTLQVVTSEYGVFNFPVVHSENFIIEVQVMSYRPYYKKYFLNDTRPILVLPPVVMKSGLVQLKGVEVKTVRGPQERGDTTEFWASDYIVRDFARLEDMLKRMEGFSSDADGRLSYKGKPINRALFNGTKYFGGDVSAAIKELPADIVERIQIIQDNETGTGPRLTASEPSSQTLNIVTKPDKSAGRMYQVNAEGGTQDRYKGSASARTIDGSNQRSITVASKQEPLGVMLSEPIGTISNMAVLALGASPGGGSGGMSKSSVAEAFYGNKIGKLSFGVNYLFRRTHSLSEMEDVSEEFFKEGSLKKNSTRTADNTSSEHIASLNADLIKSNFSIRLLAGAAIVHRESENYSEIRQSGLLENVQRASTGQRSDVPSFNLSMMTTFFGNRKVQLNLGLSSNSGGTKGRGHDNTDIFGTDVTKPDSSLYLLQQQKTISSYHNVDVSLRYSWRTKLSFVLRTTPALNRNTDLNYRDQVTSGQTIRLNDLSNDNLLMNYKLPASLTMTYNYNERWSVDLKGSYEINWQHTRLNLKELDLSTRTSVFLPGVMIKYMGKGFENFNASYNRDINLPSLLQLNMKPYYLTPFDVVIGNKDLANGLVDRWRLDGSYLIPGIRVQTIAGFSYSTTHNDIAANRLVRVDTATNTIRTETHYLNVSGGNKTDINYSLSRNFRQMNVTLKLDSKIAWGKQLYFADGNLETTVARNANHSLYASFTPLKWLDIAPGLAYSTNDNRNSLQPGRPLYNNEFNAQIKGGVFLPADIKVNFSARQNITRASSLQISQHPFVLNANIEKRFLKKKDAIISFVVMDAFQQNNNNIITQTVTGYSNALTGTKSRYFLCQLSWFPQRFTRSKSATGVRRGDGSFVQ
jgi:hypothetical protein